MEKIAMQDLGAKAFLSAVMPQAEVWTVLASRARSTVGNRVLALLQPGVPPQLTAISPDCTPSERLRYESIASLAAISAPSLEVFLTGHVAAAPECVQINMHAHLTCKVPVIPNLAKSKRVAKVAEVTPAEPEAGTVLMDGQRMPAVAMGVCKDMIALAVILKDASRASITTRWVNLGEFTSDAHAFALLTRSLTWAHFDAGQQAVPIVDLAGEFSRHARRINNRIIHAAMLLILDHRMRNQVGVITPVDQWAFDQACVQLADGAGFGTVDACATLLQRATGIAAQLTQAETWRIGKIDALRALGEKVNPEAIIQQVGTMLARIAIAAGIIKDSESDAVRLMVKALDEWTVSAASRDPLAKEVATSAGSRLACIGALRDPVLRARYHPSGAHRYYDMVLDTISKAVELDTDLPPIGSSYVHAAVELTRCAASPTLNGGACRAPGQ